MDAYYCLEQAGHDGYPLECKNVRCDECPNRGKIIPKKPLAEDAGYNMADPRMLNAVALTGGGQTRFALGKNVEWYDTPKATDPVNHPNHYARWPMEPIEFIFKNDLPGWLANVIKYTMRYDAKDGLQDLYKARSYLDMKIRQLEGAERFWEKPVAEERKLNDAVS